MRLLPLAAALLAVTPALAQDTGRFELAPAPGGFTRLDTATGAVSHCARRDDGVWYCEPLDGSQADPDRRLDQLTATIDDLAGRLDALSARVDGLAAVVEGAPPPAIAPPPAVDVAGSPPGLANELVRRFVAMVRRLKTAAGGAS